MKHNILNKLLNKNGTIALSAWLGIRNKIVKQLKNSFAIKNAPVIPSLRNSKIFIAWLFLFNQFESKLHNPLMFLQSSINLSATDLSPIHVVAQN